MRLDYPPLVVRVSLIFSYLFVRSRSDQRIILYPLFGHSFTLTTADARIARSRLRLSAGDVVLVGSDPTSEERGVAFGEHYLVGADEFVHAIFELVLRAGIPGTMQGLWP